MQIIRTSPYPSLPAALESPRERTASESLSLVVQPQGVASSRAARAIEDIRSAEKLLNHRQARNADGFMAQEGRQQKALAAYRALQQSDERAYVSEVLGIDVYA